MCELFGICSRDRVSVNALLKEFAGHSRQHPNGWGMAIFYGEGVSLEKEPLPAFQSSYLRERLRYPLEVTGMIAHIRLATRGAMDYVNCHPFVKRDYENRAWTLAHNGTIFDTAATQRYVHFQEGQTDSERILCLFIDRMNRRQKELKRVMTANERFSLLDELIGCIAPHNKLNLLFYDSEFLYVHTNYEKSLFVKQQRDTAIFATVPLDREDWEPVPMNTLLAYREGKCVYKGTNHGCTYRDNPEDMRLIFLDYAAL